MANKSANAEENEFLITLHGSNNSPGGPVRSNSRPVRSKRSQIRSSGRLRRNRLHRRSIQGQIQVKKNRRISDNHSPKSLPAHPSHFSVLVMNSLSHFSAAELEARILCMNSW